MFSLLLYYISNSLIKPGVKVQIKAKFFSHYTSIINAGTLTNFVLANRFSPLLAESQHNYYYRFVFSRETTDTSFSGWSLVSVASIISLD